MIVGNIGSIRMHTFSDGKKNATIALATSERWKDKETGERKERTDWHSVVLSGGIADVVEKYCAKGDKVAVRGKLRTRKYIKDSGEEAYVVEVVVGLGGEFTMLSSKKDKATSQEDTQQQSERRPQERAQTPARKAPAPRQYDEDLDDECPF